MLLPRDIHIWQVELDRSRDRIWELSQCLNEQERHRAAKFINPLHGDRWTVARGYLRQILARYLDLAPAQIVFSYGAQGKPKIEGYPLQFNLSHSHDRAVYAISGATPVGIDIERIQPIAAAELVDRFFSTTERAIFHKLPPSMQQAAFFHAWTQKEAYLKAYGTGLSTPLDRIEVSIDPLTPAQIVSVPVMRESWGGGDKDELLVKTSSAWQIHKLEISPEYAGAIVVGGECDSFEYIDLSSIDC